MRITGSDSINWERSGWVIELLLRAEEKAGVKFRFERVPWPRALLSVQTGAVDGAFNTSYNAEPAEYGVYPTKDGRPDPSRGTVRYAYWFYDVLPTLLARYLFHIISMPMITKFA